MTNIQPNPTAADQLTMSNGVLVIKGKFQASDFVKRLNTRVGIGSHYEGTWKELEQLVTAHQGDFEPGTGSVGNDVILVNVPPAGFYTSVTAITDKNRHFVEERNHVRQEGEKPVLMNVIKGQKEPATYVQVVCYRADTLERDSGRSSDAEWEIIALNAQKDKNTPMHPATMLRNTRHEQGGTYREYTQEQWDEAYAYWENHAYVEAE